MPRGSVLFAAAISLLLFAGCSPDERSFARLDGPADVALLPADLFYEVPVAFVTNMRSGRVTQLDLKRLNVLVEDGPAPWMPGPDMAFGARRVLSEIALTWSEQTVDVWVADDSSDQLLRAPYITGLTDEGKPIWNRPSLVGEPRCFDPAGDEQDCAAELRGLRLRPGRGTTEIWTLTWQGRSWSVRGSQNGVQNTRALPGVFYQTDRGDLAFTAASGGADPELGSTIMVETDFGVQAADAGGLIMDLYSDQEARWLIAAVLPDSGPGWLSFWDADAPVLDAAAELARIELPPGAAPERIAPGRQPGVLWVADSADLPGGGRIHRVDYVPGDIDTVAMRAITTPEPIIDLAQSFDPDSDLLFLGAAYSDAVWLMDPGSEQLLDVNPFTAEVDPSHVGTLIAGMTATPGPVETWDIDEDGTRYSSYAVLVSTFGAEMFVLGAQDGCRFFSTAAGAMASVGQGASLLTDLPPESNPTMAVSDASGGAVSTHYCGGIAETERWTLRYSEQLQSYEVEGSRSGIQEGRAHEGVRYFSDNGAISFLIVPGTKATSEGDRWSFLIDDGAAPLPLQELPGDPLVYTERYDDRQGAWWKLRERQVVVVPHLGNDIVLAMDVAGFGTGLRVFQ